MVLVYYIYDLNRYRRYYSQTEFVAMQVAQQLQSILSTRTNKTLTKTDFQNIGVTAWLTAFPGKTMFYEGSGYPLGYGWCTWIYYVKGLAGGKASCGEYILIIPLCSGTKMTSPSYIHVHLLSYDYGGSLVRRKVNVTPTEIYPSLKIKEGEVKIIVETAFSSIENKKFTLSNGKSITGKQAFGFYLLKPTSRYCNYKYTYFNSVVIFTPKPELAKALAFEGGCPTCN